MCVVELVLFYCTLRCLRPMLKLTCLYICGVRPVYFVGGTVEFQWYWMVEEGMFGVVVGSRYLTEDVGGLCNPCGSRHVNCSSVFAGLCGATSLLVVRVHLRL